MILSWTSLTQATLRAISPARSFRMLVFTQPLNSTTPLKVLTFTSSRYRYCPSSASAAPTRQEMAWSSFRWAAACRWAEFCVERLLAQPVKPTSNGNDPRQRTNPKALSVLLLFGDVFDIRYFPLWQLLVYRDFNLSCAPDFFHGVKPYCGLAAGQGLSLAASVSIHQKMTRHPLTTTRENAPAAGKQYPASREKGAHLDYHDQWQVRGKASRPRVAPFL